MKIGFTGTRKGMTQQQFLTFQRVTESWYITEFHHGACVGADEQAVTAISNVIPSKCIFAHPPADGKLLSRVALGLSANVHEPMPYLQRDREIVRDSWILLSTPETFEEVLRSGTWTTMRYAKAARHPVFNIQPNGLIKVD